MAGKEGSSFWADITQRQKDMRVAFQNEQAGKRSGRAGAALTYKANLTNAALTSSASKWKADLVFNFSVVAPALGLIQGEFKRVSGLTTDEWEFETFREGGDNGAEHILPTHTKAGRITLEYALKHPDPFLIWCVSMGTGCMVYQPITITLLNNKNIPRAMWEIPQCLIAKIEGPELDATASEIATNKVELVHNGLIRIDVPV